MEVNQFEIWVADLSPKIGTGTGKTRPVLIIQTDLLNKVLHPSTIICPITTNIKVEAEILRVHIKKGVANVKENCDIMIDQLRAIDNKRLIKKIGKLPDNLVEKVKQNLMIILDIWLSFYNFKISNKVELWDILTIIYKISRVNKGTGKLLLFKSPLRLFSYLKTLMQVVESN